MAEKFLLRSVQVKAIIDDYSDTSWLGEFTDTLERGVIVRSLGGFYEKLPAPMERDLDGRFLCKGKPYDLPAKGRDFRGFIPYAGGEKVGTRLYYKYGLQNWERMEKLAHGDWYFLGIMAKATVMYAQNGYYRLERLSSSGVWGVESDSDIDSIKQEELDDLKEHLKIFGVDLSNWDELTKDLELAFD